VLKYHARSREKRSDVRIKYVAPSQYAWTSNTMFARIYYRIHRSVQRDSGRVIYIVLIGLLWGMDGIFLLFYSREYSLLCLVWCPTPSSNNATVYILDLYFLLCKLSIPPSRFPHLTSLSAHSISASSSRSSKYSLLRVFQLPIFWWNSFDYTSHNALL